VAGEIGHVSIDPAGPECICGNRGCLTTFVGTSALLDRVRQLALGYPDSPLSQGDPDLDRLVEATLEGDFLARRVVREAASHLGTAIAGLLNLMNPGAVILGGSLMRVGDHLLEPLLEAVASRTLTTSVLGSRIGTSELGDRNVALGAATLVLAGALASPELFQRSTP
jgi:predicted NBD/HSP70 family sugar kinase